MKFPLCLPMQLDSVDKILYAIEKNSSEYNFFEIYVDFIPYNQIEQIHTLVEKFPNQCILTLRRVAFAVQTWTDQERKKLLIGLHEKPCYVDLDIREETTELQYIIENRLKINLVCSYHNYKLTQEYKAIIDLVHKMEKFRPAVYKVTTMCEHEEDCLVLLAVISFFKRIGRRFVVAGMGDAGKVARIVGTVWGSEWSYVPVEKTAESAPGQFTLEAYKKILEAFEIKS